MYGQVYTFHVKTPHCSTVPLSSVVWTQAQHPLKLIPPQQAEVSTVHTEDPVRYLRDSAQSQKSLFVLSINNYILSFNGPPNAQVAPRGSKITRSHDKNIRSKRPRETHDREGSIA